MLNASLIFTALLAGLAGGSHCVGMCGGIATMLSRPNRAANIIPIKPIEMSNSNRIKWLEVFQLHLGRLSTYAMAGALVGALGAAGLLLKPVMPVQAILFFIGNLSLIYLGVRCLGYQPAILARIGARINFQGFSRMLSGLRFPVQPYSRGVLWGCLPCGLVYGVLPIALISGTPWSGALLMFCFGLGTVPYLLFAQGLAARFGQRKLPMWLAVVAAAILIGLGCLGLVMPNDHRTGMWWC